MEPACASTAPSMRDALVRAAGAQAGKNGGTMHSGNGERLGEGLLRRGWTLGVAESCTGGLLGSRITDTPGSSAYFLGGVIAYSNLAKQRLLGVRAESLDRHGAVSRQVALEMAQGIRHALGTDVGISITGIAGPGGAAPGKPVGTTWIGVSGPAGEAVRHYLWKGDRLSNRDLSAEAALTLALSQIGT
jgi:PncC family amidohydrolase